MVQPIERDYNNINIVDYDYSSDDSDDDYHSDDSDENVSDDSTKCKYNLALTELYEPRTHGFTSDSDPNIIGHYLVVYKLNPHNKRQCNQLKTLYYNNYLMSGRHRHPTIRNYVNIIVNDKYIQPQIAECIYLRGGECVAIIKTYWLRLVQRTWKRVFAERKRIINLRKTPNHLFHRSFHGTWPHDSRHIPSILGMMSSSLSSDNMTITF